MIMKHLYLKIKKSALSKFKCYLNIFIFLNNKQKRSYLRFSCKIITQNTFDNNSLLIKNSVKELTNKSQSGNESYVELWDRSKFLSFRIQEKNKINTRITILTGCRLYRFYCDISSKETLV